MSTTRLVSTFATAIAMTGCCGGEDHAVTLSAPSGFTVTRDGVTRQVLAVMHYTRPPVASSTLEFVYNTIEGARSGDGITLSLTGSDAINHDQFILALALPVTIRVGDVYTVSTTYSVDPGVSGPPLFGPYDLKQSNQAEAALTVATYNFPPATYDVTYRATTSSGTIRVTERDPGRIMWEYDLNFLDATGNAIAVTGRLQADSERVQRSCS
jgi:hypothetical protein